MPEYTVVDLSPDRLESGYPIVRLIAPEIDLRHWLSYARGVRRGGGVLGLAAAGDMLLGVAAYQRHQSLRGGRGLFIDLFAVFELARCGAGRAVLLDALEERAEALGCSALLFSSELAGRRMQPGGCRRLSYSRSGAAHRDSPRLGRHRIGP